ncbi:hypothetical protein H2508_01340 [Parahaliea sp. F7430]|uniref:Uncharacterized protein n=1 Tax=Sediminihaliea albiluteola TaxID=2758564 RepID=A0A7W2YIQ0_9GAMM|nr:hypothetical protein [Sediminihaliea albiluteola]MBA6411754.1 hypothetical protein [Sediminihaliea albiluteola]
MKYWQLFTPGILAIAFLVMLADNYSQTGTIKLTLVAGTMTAFAGFIVLKRSIK